MCLAFIAFLHHLTEPSYILSSVSVSLHRYKDQMLETKTSLKNVIVEKEESKHMRRQVMDEHKQRCTHIT